MTFQAGVSGNPGGRPKALVDVLNLARAHTEPAIATLATIMVDATQPAPARVAAATAVLDRGWGRPAQSVALTAPDGGPLVIQHRVSVDRVMGMLTVAGGPVIDGTAVDVSGEGET